MTRLFMDRHHPKTPRVREISERVSPEIQRIRLLADENLKSARNAFAETFGFEVKDKRFDREFAELFSHALMKGRKTVQVPIRLALALWLREGGAGRGVGALSETPWSNKGRILEKVRNRKRELQRQGYRAGIALENAANELSPGAEFSPEAIIERIRHPSGKRKKKGGRSHPRNSAE